MNHIALSLVFLSSALIGCSDDGGIDSDTEARYAYLGFDSAIDKALNLGFDGFNAASSANIPTQSGVGDETGTMDIDGQVDQGASDNKGMRLLLTLVDYSDGPFIFTDTDSDTEVEILVTYDSPTDLPPALDLSLRNIPNGTFTGTLLGKIFLSGDLDAEGDFNLALSGDIEDNGGLVQRKAGTLKIVGTVTSGDGSFDVDILR